MIDPRRLGEAFKRARQERGLRREDVAAMARVSQSTVDNLEQGRAIPRVETLEKLGAVVGLSVVELLREAALFQPAVA